MSGIVNKVLLIIHNFLIQFVMNDLSNKSLCRVTRGTFDWWFKLSISSLPDRTTWWPDSSSSSPCSMPVWASTITQWVSRAHLKLSNTGRSCPGSQQCNLSLEELKGVISDILRNIQREAAGAADYIIPTEMISVMDMDMKPVAAGMKNLLQDLTCVMKSTPHEGTTITHLLL